MKWNPFDFNVDPNMTPEQLAYKRAINANVGAGLGDANYGGAGLAQLLTGLKLGYQNKGLNEVEQTGRQGAQDAMSALYQQPMTILGMNPMQPGISPQPMDPNSPQGIAADAMSAIGKGPGGIDFTALESQYGLPSGYLSQTAQIESGMNPNAQNPNSSAGGLFQFIDSTAQQYGLTDKMDPVASANAAAKLAADNAAYLRKTLGREPTAGELYLAHQQGAGGAAQLLANPGAPAASIVGADAVGLNGGNSNMTAAEFAGKWTGKFGNTPQQVTSQIPTAQIYEALQNPWLKPEERAMLTGMLDTQQGAPMQDLQMQKAQLELQQAQMQTEAMRNPGPPAPPEVLAERRALAAAAGLTPDQPEYSTYMLTGNMVAPNGGTEFGLTPVFGTNKDGKTVLMQIGKDGTAIETVLPDGVTPDLSVEAFQRAQGTQLGKLTADAQVDLQGALNKGQDALDLIQSVRDDPALPSITGVIQGGLFAPGIPGISGGQAGKDLSVKIDQLKGQTFLQAFESLKGAGQITEVEGQKATEAMARLNTAQSVEAYQAALDDLAGVIERAMDTARKKTGGTTDPQAAPAAKPTHRWNPETRQLEPIGGN
jgi:hypothetical protein